MHKFRVFIDGNDGNGKQFSESIDVEAIDEKDAGIKVNKAFLLAGPQGGSHKYDEGPEALIYNIMDIIQLDK